MKKIDRVEELPEWFQLSAYAACKDFGAAEWLWQLYRRRDLLSFHPMRTGRVLVEKDVKDCMARIGLKFWLRTVGRYADAVRKSPVLAAQKGDFEIGEWFRGAITQVTPMDIFIQRNRDQIAETNEFVPRGTNYRWEVLDPEQVDLDTFKDRPSGEPLALNNYDGTPEKPLLAVDLGVPDALLKDAFAAWLKQARVSQATKPTAPLYTRWARYGLLPYLDLWIWSMETDTHIPDRVMSAAISTYDAGEANLRKTVAPLARSLMQDMSELQALAKQEAAANTPPEAETI